MNIRRLTRADYASFHELINDFRETQFTEAQFHSILERMSQAPSEIWVIEKEGKLVATGTLLLEQKFIFNCAIMAHIEDVCVKKELRRMGLGKTLVLKLLERAREVEGCYKITLDCADNNIPFYESCGFERRGNQLSMLCNNPI